MTNPTEEPRGTARDAIRLRPFRLLLLAGMGLQLGGWIQRVALLWLVYELTGSAAQLGGVAFVQTIFVLVIAPLTGPLADQIGARRSLMSATTLQATGAVVLVVAVTGGWASLPLLYVVSVTYGVGQSINQPMRNLLVYDAVGRELLKPALALNALTGNLMRVVGPSIGGILVGFFGSEFAFMTQAVLLGASVAVVWMLRIDVTRAGARTSLLSEIGSGIGHVFSNPPVRTSILISFVTFTLVYPYMQFMAVFADELGGGATGYGLLSSAIGVGSLIGSTYVATGRGGMRTMLWGGAIYMMLLVIFTQMTQFWVAFGVLALAGIAHSLFSTLNQALLQLNAGEEYRARVMGLYTWAGGLEPFTVLGLGFLADKFGVTNTLGSSLAVAGVIAALFALNQSRTEEAARRASEVA
ncbi:MAG: MFS transporter [Dehalococcoidia bacterium]|jgi:MFS family permease|nr:MFS transporter [Dehalococcoidia bacterium]